MSEYNGWTNKATWLVNVWVRNDLQAIEMTTRLEGEEALRIIVTGLLMESLSKDQQSGFASDMLQCAINEVNFKELIDSWKDCDDIGQDCE